MKDMKNSKVGKVVRKGRKKNARIKQDGKTVRKDRKERQEGN